MSNNKSLHRAHKNKNDEFYTQINDIKKELKYYKNLFRGKVVYCNCNDGLESNFLKYFVSNFNFLGIKKLITRSFTRRPVLSLHIRIEINKVNYRTSLSSIKENSIKLVEGAGDFRSEASIADLKKADIVVTNPPFSLFREYMDQLIEYNKKFLVIGNINAITYVNIFPLIKENKIRLGANNNSTWFRIPDDSNLRNRASVKIKNNDAHLSSNIGWFTNLNCTKNYRDLILHKKYNPKDYPKYDNYDAINVSKVSDIPMDYGGVMGVPITFLDKYNPDQFEIVGANRGRYQESESGYGQKSYLNGAETFKRLFIKNKKLLK